MSFMTGLVVYLRRLYAVCVFFWAGLITINVISTNG